MKPKENWKFWHLEKQYKISKEHGWEPQKYIFVQIALYIRADYLFKYRVKQ